MGNTPSTENLRDAHRLSKPKLKSIGTSPVISSPQLKPDLMRSQTDVLGGLPREHDAVLEETRNGELRTRPSVRRKIRNQLLGDDSSREPSEEPELEVDKMLRPSPSHARLSQSLSPQPSYNTLPGSPPAASSIDPRNVDLQTAMMILEELRKTASPEDLVALHKALLPSRTLDSYSPTEPGPSAAAVMRKSSLAVPGLATRTVSQSTAMEPIPSEEAEWERGPAQKAQGEVKSAQEPKGRFSIERSHTPGDLEYSHIGTHRIGSLVVMNGLPVSPGASISEMRQLARRSTDGKREEEYFTAEESDPSSRTDTESENESILHAADRLSSEFGSRLEGSRHSKGDSISTIRRPRSGSPLKREVRQTSTMANDLDVTPKQKLRQRDTITLEQLAQRDDEREALVPPPRKMGHHRSDSAESLAIEYQAEIPYSPFDTDVPDEYVSPELEPTPVDEGYDEAISPIEDSPPAAKTVEGSSGNRRQHRHYEPSVTRTTALGSHPPDLSEIPVNKLHKLSRPPQTKSDSGYSSGASTYAQENLRHSLSNRSTASDASNNKAQEVISQSTELTESPASGYAQNPYAQDFHAQDLHAQELHAQELHAQELHAQELHAQELHAQELHAQELYAQELHAQELHAQELHAQELHAQELHAQELHAQELHAQDPYAQDPYAHEHHGQDPLRASFRSDVSGVSAISGVSGVSALSAVSAVSAVSPAISPVSGASPNRDFSPLPASISSSVTLDQEKSPMPSERSSKSWRKSLRFPLGRMLSSDSSDKSIKSTKSQHNSSNASETTLKPPKTPKRLQKKRPQSYTISAPSAVDPNMIPRIPSGLQSSFQERPDRIDPSAMDKTLGLPYETHDRSKAPMVLGPGGKPRPKSSGGASFRARQNRFTAPPESLNTFQPPMPGQPQESQQRRISLSRMIRPKSAGRPSGQATRPTSDEEGAEPQFAREYSSYGNVNTSLGHSPYDAAFMASRQQQFGAPMAPLPPQHGPNGWAVHQRGPPRGPPNGPNSANRRSVPPEGLAPAFMPNPPQPNSSPYGGRRRPKSFHGRAHKRMEAVGEEEMDDAADISATDIDVGPEGESTRGRHNLRSAKSFEAGDDRVRGKMPRPKSMGAPVRGRSPFRENMPMPNGPNGNGPNGNGSNANFNNPYGYSRADFQEDIPPVPRHDWGGQERYWRARREDAGHLDAQPHRAPMQHHPEPRPAPRPLPAPVRSAGNQGTFGGLDLPTIGATARSRRPQSELLSRKSQPNMRRERNRDSMIMMGRADTQIGDALVSAGYDRPVNGSGGHERFGRYGEVSPGRELGGFDFGMDDSAMSHAQLAKHHGQARHASGRGVAERGPVMMASVGERYTARQAQIVDV